MPNSIRRVHASTAVLAASLIAILVLFGNTADYDATLHDGLVALLLMVSATSAWFAGARTLLRGDPARRLLAVAAALLVAPFVLFSLLLGVGPPHVQPAQENDLRFLVLAINALLVGAGLLTLKEALAQVGERLHSTLGGVAIVLATPFYVAFALIQRIDYVAAELDWSWAQSVDGMRHELTPLDAWSIAALFIAGALTYLATAAFARSLALAGWLGTAASRAFVIISAIGLGFLMARGFAYPSSHAAFSHWYTVPGFVAGIPAVPWMAPCAMAVLLLRRLGLAAAREEQSSVRLNPAVAPARPAASSSRF